MIKRQLLAVTLIAMLVITACGRSQPLEATATTLPTDPPAPTSLPTPSATSTPAMETATVIPSPTDAVLPEVRLDLIGHIGGASNALAIQDQYVYIGVGLRLVALDVSDPFHPQALGQSEPLPGLVDSVQLADGHAIVLTDDHSLSVIDITDPDQLLLVGSLKLEQSAHGISVSDGYAYVAGGDAGLVIVDISIPTTPHEVAVFRTQHSATAVAVSGNYAFVGEGNQLDLSGALVAVDVSDPTAPRVTDSLDVSYVQAISISDNLALVATFGMQIVDISEPFNLHLVGT